MIFVHVLVEVCSFHHVQICFLKAADETDCIEVFFTSVMRVAQSSKSIDDDT